MKKIIGLIVFWVVLHSASFYLACSKHPTNPVPDPDPVPCDTVFVVCGTLDITVEFMVIKDRSAPNVYLRKRAGHPDKTYTVIETSPTPIPFVFTEVFEDYTGEAFSIEKVSGSLAEALGIAIVKLECAQ